MPKIYFPGGALLGCDAGFLNPAKIKGTHTAIKSVIIVAKAAYLELKTKINFSLKSYQEDFISSSIYKELTKAKNFKSCMNKGMV